MRNDALDLLCSDYAPATLLPAVFRVAACEGWDLPRAAWPATVNAARAARLDDRGRIAAGLRADLIAVRMIGDWPQVVGTRCGGQAVYRRRDKRPEIAGGR